MPGMTRYLRASRYRTRVVMAGANLGVRGEAYRRRDYGGTWDYDSERTKSFAGWNFGTHVFDVSGPSATQKCVSRD